MFSCILTEIGVIEETGVPNYFLKDEDLDQVLKNPDVALELYKHLGKCCIGRLGQPGEDGVYREQKFQFNLDVVEKGEFSFYEKIRGID